MAPNSVSSPQEVQDDDWTPDKIPGKDYQVQLVWKNVIGMTYLHVAALYGAYLMFTAASWSTIVFVIALYFAAGLGITAGVHRLWSHRAYKAKLPLQIILVMFNTLAHENSALEWARDHRVHHKYSDTNADPHNASRGFFFSHVGWLLCRKHPDVAAKGKAIDMSDLESNPVLSFQKKYYSILMPLICFILPTVIPVLCWGETWTNSWFVAAMFRYAFVLNMTWLVNSAAHMWGSRPYDQSMLPRENLGVTLGALGEGWHNYHHAFPWDYKTNELGKFRINFTTSFIHFFVKIGWAYDLKTVSDETVRNRILKAGDGSHELTKSHGGEVWGWGDRDMSQEDYNEALIINKKPN